MTLLNNKNFTRAYRLVVEGVHRVDTFKKGKLFPALAIKIKRTQYRLHYLITMARALFFVKFNG